MPNLFDYLKQRQEEEKMKQGGQPPLPPGQGSFADSMRKAFKTPEAVAKPEYQDINPNAGGIRNFDRALGAAAGQRKPARVQYNKSMNKSKLIYNDGTEEIIDGRYNGR